METSTLLLFFLTVFPLICTPGPDILFTASQGLSSGKSGAIRAVIGILLGYSAHAILSALGVAAIVNTSLLLFQFLKWLGVIYLLFLAITMIYSSFKRKDDITLQLSLPAARFIAQPS